MSPKTHLFSCARKQKDFPFLLGGAAPSRTVPKKPLQVALSLLKRVDLRSQKEEILGKKIAWGRVGWTEQKSKKGCAKKGGNSRAENGCANFMGAWDFGFFLKDKKNLHVHKVLVLPGDLVFFWGGEDFSDRHLFQTSVKKKKRNPKRVSLRGVFH